MNEIFKITFLSNCYAEFIVKKGRIEAFSTLSGLVLTPLYIIVLS